MSAVQRLTPKLLVPEMPSAVQMEAAAERGEPADQDPQGSWVRELKSFL